MQMLWCSASISPTILCPILQEHSIMPNLYIVQSFVPCADQRKSSGTKAAHKKIMKIQNPKESVSRIWASLTWLNGTISYVNKFWCYLLEKG